MTFLQVKHYVYAFAWTFILSTACAVSSDPGSLQQEIEAQQIKRGHPNAAILAVYNGPDLISLGSGLLWGENSHAFVTAAHVAAPVWVGTEIVVLYQNRRGELEQHRESISYHDVPAEIPPPSSHQVARHNSISHDQWITLMADAVYSQAQYSLILNHDDDLRDVMNVEWLVDLAVLRLQQTPSQFSVRPQLKEIEIASDAPDAGATLKHSAPPLVLFTALPASIREKEFNVIPGPADRFLHAYTFVDQNEFDFRMVGRFTGTKRWDAGRQGTFSAWRQKRPALCRD